MDLTVIGMLAGGIGIFLLAVGMLTDGLKLAAGVGLRNMLKSWTRSPLHGVFTGFLITSVVQSSSAITVATIGFVNAGLLNLTQALGVVYGANIGTTLTGWLVAIIGFDINISALALPIIGVGMLLRLTGGRSRRAAIGMALVGFGLFFIGIQTLKDAFEGIVATLDMERYTLQGIGGLLFYLGLGFLMTVLTQSSSAAIAITLTAASGGLLGIYAAGAMVIGANLGTTSTAVISVLGATSNAKRVAGAHVMFNSITGVVALLLLPLMFVVVDAITGFLNIESEPAVSLALFHTVFNVLGVLIMLPLTGRLATFLERRFKSQEETLGTPRYLDRNVSITPDLALDAAVNELMHLAEVSIGYCRLALKANAKPNKHSEATHDAVVRLSRAVGEFIMDLQRNSIPHEVAKTLPKVLRCSQYYLTAVELAKEVLENPSQSSELGDTELLSILNDFHREVSELLNLMDITAAGFSSAEFEQKTAAVKDHYDEYKERNLRRSVEVGLEVSQVSGLLEHSGNVRRMATQLAKGTNLLSNLYRQINQQAQQRAHDDVLHEELTG
jgi:phosphate:Na+ symporter